MKKILITGASGFVGGFLAEHLLSLGDSEIHGTYLDDASMQASVVKDRILFHKTDLTNTSETEKLIEELKPDYVYHLAAMASVPASFKDPIGTFHTNIDAQINLFEALRKFNLLGTKVLIVASSEIYGYVKPEDIPVDEETPLRPANPYAVSKITQDYLGFQYSLSYKMPIIRVRAFNHIGPRQAPVFVVSEFAKKIAGIEKGSEPVLRVGNLEAKRDFTDVRDIVRGYQLLLEKGIAGEAYNIGSGISRSVQSVLDALLALSSVKISVERDPEKMRPSDIPDIVCDNSKIVALTGWKPDIPFEQTLKDTLEYWRKQ